MCLKKVYEGGRWDWIYNAPVKVGIGEKAYLITGYRTLDGSFLEKLVDCRW